MIKTILVPVYHEQSSDMRIDFAVQLANNFDAHIKVLHVITPPVIIGGSMPMESAYMISTYEDFEKNAEEKADRLKEKYENKLTKAGVRFDWCQEKGELVNVMYAHARAADLTIITQRNDSADDLFDRMNDFIIGNGMPVIVIPKEGAPMFTGKNILVAWDGGRECAKATHDALPFLKMADKVTVATISEDIKFQVPEADICVHLSRHGVNAEALTLTDAIQAEKRILDTAISVDADLIVAGAWGHRRLTEIIFGGVTRNLISNQEKAVFIAH